MAVPILKVENLVKRINFWNPKVIVNGFSVQINTGEIVALLGGNGAGKSTTLDMLSGLSRPTSGKISRYQPETDSWRVITNEPLYKRAQQGICYLSQNPSVFVGLTTRQNLLGIMEIMNHKDLRSSMKAYDSSLTTREEFCDALLNRFDLYKRRDEKVSVLSGGEKHRLAIARSFIRKPKLILLDEPYAAVDVAGIELCGQLFRRVRDMGVSILIVDHNIEEVLKLSDRVVFLNEGKIYMIGTPYEIVHNTFIQDTFLSNKTPMLLEMFSTPGSYTEQSSSAKAVTELFKSNTVRIE